MEEIKEKMLRIMDRSMRAIKEMDDANMKDKISIIMVNNDIIHHYWLLYDNYRNAKEIWDENKYPGRVVS